jgi:hypothetical protein
VNDFFGVVDAIGWDTAAMSVPQQEPGGLCKQARIGGLGDAAAQQDEYGARDGKS